MQNILQTVFQHLIFAKGLKRWPNMLNIMQHRNLLLSVHKVDGDGWWKWCWTWWWSWGWWRMEMARRRSWILCNARTRAVCSSAWNSWGPGFSPFQKVVRAIADILVNQMWIFQNIPKAWSMVIFQISCTTSRSWSSLQTCEHRWHLFHYAHLLSLPWKIVSPVVDGTTIWIVAMIFSQRSSEDLLWAKYKHIKKIITIHVAWKCFDMLEMFFECSFCIFYSLPFVT